MSGHSKWATIKHKKGAADKARGKLFAKLARQIEVAARSGGGDPDMNPSLRTAVAKAKASQMTNDAIDRAVKRGTGEAGADNYEAITYEGYAPGGVALLIEVLTDNRNRTVSEVRHLFSKHNGNMAESGAVGWIFDQKGLIAVSKDVTDEETLMMITLEAGADDLVEGEEEFEVYTPLQSFDVLRKALDENEVAYSRATLTRIPQNSVAVDGKVAEQLIRLLEALEDQDDVQNVYANFEMDDSVLAELTA